MTTSETQAPLRISQSPGRQLRTAGILAVVICAYILFGATGLLPQVIMWFGVVVFGIALVIGLYQVLKASRASWELTLDEDGVTVQGHPTMPWADFTEVRQVDARPRWLFLLARRYHFVAFIGQPGVQVPSLPSARGRSDTSRFSRAREKMYGTQLVLPPSIFDASTDTVLRAAEHFGKLPVTRL